MEKTKVLVEVVHEVPEEKYKMYVDGEWDGDMRSRENALTVYPTNMYLWEYTDSVVPPRKNRTGV